jgi:transposase InsO family protein
METHLRTELVLAALNMALGQRRPRGVIHHSDHGSQYTALAFGKRCDEAGVRPSMGSVGDCFDNAMCESLFATLECELRRPHQLHNPGRGAHGSVRLHRGVVQPSSPSPGPRLSIAHRLRTSIRGSTRRTMQRQSAAERIRAAAAGRRRN